MKAATAKYGAAVAVEKFQSTPPVKAATRTTTRTTEGQHISIHAAREGGDDDRTVIIGTNVISIHAAREGGDSIPCTRGYVYHISIHAAREGGDIKADYNIAFFVISIHAAREGGDCTAPLVSIGIQHFNPRRP